MGDAVAAEHQESFQILRDQGFTERDAKLIAESHPPETIRNQINWLERRNPVRNRRGLLRRAIEENWEAPDHPDGPPDALRSTPGHLFAAHFYAGFHGNNHDPVAEPSANDVRQAERFLEQVSALSPAQSQIAEWGRALGRMHAAQEGEGSRRVISCVVALRHQGDELLRRLRSESKKRHQGAVLRAREAHHKEHFAAYLGHLRQRESEIRQSDPDAYAAFVARRARDRAQMERNPYFTHHQRSEQLAKFDSDQHRLQDFQASGLFPDVLAFDAWDKRLNPSPFREKEVAP